MSSIEDVYKYLQKLHAPLYVLTVIYGHIIFLGPNKISDKDA